MTAHEQLEWLKEFTFFKCHICEEAGEEYCFGPDEVRFTPENYLICEECCGESWRKLPVFNPFSEIEKALGLPQPVAEEAPEHRS